MMPVPIPKAKVLVVDDEPDTVELLAFNLKQAAFQVLQAFDGEEAVRKARSEVPDLVVLDLMLPGMGGFEVCRVLKGDPRTASIPILMLTAKTAEVDRVLGLELGADDYVTKPFSPRELVLRIRNLLRRRASAASPPTRVVVGPLVIDTARHEVLVEGKPLTLTATEFRLLTLLAHRRGRVQNREQLLKEAWGYEKLIDTRTVDTHVRRLRAKLGPAAKHVETVQGVGYRLKDS